MSMEPDLLFWIINNISQKKTILEFGSGNATVTLSKFFKMISVEENIEFVEKVKEACPSDSPIKFIHAPVGSPSEWYDAQTIKEQLSTQKYDVIIIDGPAYGSRTEFLNNLDIFDLDNFSEHFLFTYALTSFETENEYVGNAHGQSFKMVAFVGLFPLIIRNGILKSSIDPSI